MKQQLIALSLLACFFVNAQETVVNISLQPNYSETVFYDFETNSMETFSAHTWDIAFLQAGQFAIGTRVNDAAGIEVFQATNNLSDWANIDPANNGAWTQLFNSDTTWTVGAFDQGTATYGWGEYNPMNHQVEGTVVFVLQYPNGNFRKFMIENFYNGYGIKYADWNLATSSWEADETYFVANSTSNFQFNYFNMTTDAEVIASPEISEWDIVLKKYSTDLGDGTIYPVTGVLQNSTASVAENLEPTGTEDTSNLNYSTEINTIGHDWKSFDGTGYSVDSDKYFYLKKGNGTIYRFHFLTFEGSSTGNLSFEYEDVTGQMSTTNFDAENSFSVFPNPSKDKRIQILYETNLMNSGEATINLYSLLGKKVYGTKVKNNGFYNQTIDLSQLSSGVYLLEFQVNGFSKTQKIVLK